MESRLEDLEVKAAFLEKHLTELDGLVRELFEAIASLRVELGVLRESVRPEQAVERGSEKPPHY